jgi:hypothetical protein
MTLKNIVTVLFLLIVNVSIGQKNPGNKYINNKTIAFRIFTTSLDAQSRDSVIPSQNVIKVNLSDEVKLKLKKNSAEEWLELLNNKNTDWAANLILYELYEKDATKFMVITSRKKWESKYKSIDTHYWSNFFAK